MNKKILFVSLCWATACAVKPSSFPAVVESAGTSASTSGNAVMPKLTVWNGKPLPSTQSTLATVFIVSGPRDPGRSWAIETDGDHVAAWVDLDSKEVGSLVQIMLGLKVLPLLTIIKVPPPPPPRDEDAAFYLKLADDMHQDLVHAADLCCNGPAVK